METKRKDLVKRAREVKRQNVLDAEQSKVFNQEEAANYLHISTPTLRKYIRLGKIAFRQENKKFFITKQSLDEFLLQKFYEVNNGKIES